MNISSSSNDDDNEEGERVQEQRKETLRISQRKSSLYMAIIDHQPGIRLVTCHYSIRTTEAKSFLVIGAFSVEIIG